MPHQAVDQADHPGCRWKMESAIVVLYPELRVNFDYKYRRGKFPASWAAAAYMLYGRYLLRLRFPLLIGFFHRSLLNFSVQRNICLVFLTTIYNSYIYSNSYSQPALILPVWKRNL